MLITCPACKNSFTVPQIGAYTCPSCHGHVGVSAAPKPSVAANKKGQFGTILAVTIGVVTLGTLGQFGGSSRSGRTEAPATAAAQDAADALPMAVSSGDDTSACDRALPKLRAACPRLASTFAGECEVASSPVNAVTVSVEELGPGSVIHFGVPGPEWFLREDGTLITVNGIAGGGCDGLPDVPTVVGRDTRTKAAKRGDTAKTYEGTYGADGNYLHPDCSDFEIKVGRIYHQALWSDPSVSDEQAGRTAARAVKKKTRVRRKVAEAIYGKTLSACMQAVVTE